MYILGNWKAHKTLEEAIDWEKSFRQYLPALPSHVTVIVCPAYHHLSYFLSSHPAYALGVQDVSAYPSGAYTGELSSSMIAGLVSYALIGHSERRKYFGETDQIVSEKVKQVRLAGIKPIVCVSTTEETQRLRELVPDFVKDGMFLYEPIFAIGSGVADTPENANTTAGALVKILPVPVLYGGSVTPENVKAFADQEYISGAGVGGASLDAQTFATLVQNAIKE